MGIIKGGSQINPVIDGKNIAGILKNGSFVYKHLSSVLLKDLIIQNSTLHKVEPNFSQIATTDEGLYSMEDDYGTSYYFRGAVENNYVKFGGFYWRIIRINGDGSIRMIYDGTQAYPNAAGGSGSGGADRFTHTGQAFNSISNMSRDVKWIYDFGGNAVSCSAKNCVDEWYKTNIEDKGLGQYVSDTLFCNDASYSSSGTTVKYGAYNRLVANPPPAPKFTCTNKNDAFTVSDTTKGNGALTYPVGLITADEIVAAGGLSTATNKSYYLYKNPSYWYWTMSPHRYFSGTARVFVVFMGGYLSAYDTNYTADGGAVAPVINLKADVNVTGTGTMTDPYKIVGVE